MYYIGSLPPTPTPTPHFVASQRHIADNPRKEGLPEGELLSTVHEELDNDTDDSFCEVLPELDDIVKDTVGTNNFATSEPIRQAVPAQNNESIPLEEQFRTPHPCTSHKKETPRNETQEEESTAPV